MFDPMAWKGRSAEEQAIIDQEVEDFLIRCKEILARLQPDLPRQMSFEMEGERNGTE